AAGGQASGGSVPERLSRFAEDLYGLLRTPIFPKRSYLEVASWLREASVEDGGTVHLRTVLASPTAVDEAGSFLRCADTFRRHGFQVELKLLLVRWENLVEVAEISAEERQAFFDEQVRSVRQQVAAADFSPDAVVPVDVEAAPDSPAITAPADFKEWSDRVLAAVSDLSSADAALSRDLLWITGVYARQQS